MTLDRNSSVAFKRSAHQSSLVPYTIARKLEDSPKNLSVLKVHFKGAGRRDVGGRKQARWEKGSKVERGGDEQRKEWRKG